VSGKKDVNAINPVAPTLLVPSLQLLEVFQTIHRNLRIRRAEPDII
jgi:hypothetical protein